MFKVRTIGTLLAMSALMALPACSMFSGGRSQESRANAPATTAAATPETPPAQPTAPPIITPDIIKQAQTQLKQAGDYQGRVDGKMGPMTERGLRKWQQAHNLTPTGQLDAPTLQSMNITAGSGPQG